MTPINVAAAISIAAVLGSGTLATRKPTDGLTNVGLGHYRRTCPKIVPPVGPIPSACVPEHPADRRFVPLGNVAAHVIRAIGARGRGKCANRREEVRWVGCAGPGLLTSVKFALFVPLEESTLLGGVLLCVGYVQYPAFVLPPT